MDLCPHCAEPFEPVVDAGGGPRQDYVEDCAVCCRPIRVLAMQDEDGDYRLELFAET
jgi:hypothetical protein